MPNSVKYTHKTWNVDVFYHIFKILLVLNPFSCLSSPCLPPVSLPVARLPISRPPVWEGEISLGWVEVDRQDR